MAQLNHTIVWTNNQREAAQFLTELLDLPPARPFGPFLVVEMSNGVSLDYYQRDDAIVLQHYAFLVSDAEFDAAFARIRGRGLEYWADPARTQAGQINHHYGGRGVYFHDPSGHLMELITRPYGNEMPG